METKSAYMREKRSANTFLIFFSLLCAPFLSLSFNGSVLSLLMGLFSFVLLS